MTNRRTIPRFVLSTENFFVKRLNVYSSQKQKKKNFVVTCHFHVRSPSSDGKLINSEFSLVREKIITFLFISMKRAASRKIKITKDEEKKNRAHR